MSDIVGIYSQLAALPITFTKNDGNSATVTCRDLDELKKSIYGADCPVRQLMPLGNETDGVSMHTTFGRSAEMRWRIVDLLFWKPGNQGDLLTECGPDLVRYMAAYEAMLRTSFQLCGYTDGRKLLREVQMLPSVFTWPIDSQNVYFGMTVVLNISELVG